MLNVDHRAPDAIRPVGRGSDTKNWPQSYILKTIQTEPNFTVNRKIIMKNRLWNSCWFGKIAITADGSVLPCVFARDQIAGNVKNEELSKIIDNGMLEFWKLTKDQIYVCRDCEYRFLCYDCRPLAYGLTGDLYAKYPKCTYNPYSGTWGRST